MLFDRRKTVVVIAIVIAVASVVVGYLKVTRNLAGQADSTSAREPIPGGDRSPAKSSASKEIEAPVGTLAPPPDDAGEKALTDWMAREAGQLDLPSVDGERKAKEMAVVASRLTRSQSRRLLTTARDPQSPASQRILSTYLLVQAGPRALAELRELIVSPIVATGPAHSEDESRAMREKTLRLMAADGWLARSEADPEARRVLGDTIDEIQDPYVRRYVRDRFRQKSR